MHYELRAKDRTVQKFDTEDEAVTAARELIRAQPDSDPEIWDAPTAATCPPGPAAPRPAAWPTSCPPVATSTPSIPAHARRRLAREVGAALADRL